MAALIRGIHGLGTHLAAEVSASVAAECACGAPAAATTVCHWPPSQTPQQPRARPPAPLSRARSRAYLRPKGA